VEPRPRRADGCSHDDLLVLEKRFSAEGKAIFFACDTLAVEG